jgi:hypothetical protein
MKDSFDLMKMLLKDIFGYHDILKRLIKPISYRLYLFHNKEDINEAVVEIAINSLCLTAITTRKIPKISGMHY